MCSQLATVGDTRGSQLAVGDNLSKSDADSSFLTNV